MSKQAVNGTLMFKTKDGQWEKLGKGVTHVTPLEPTRVHSSAPEVVMNVRPEFGIPTSIYDAPESNGDFAIEGECEEVIAPTDEQIRDIMENF